MKEPSAGSSRRVQVLAWGSVGVSVLLAVTADVLVVLNIGTPRLGEVFGFSGFFTLIAVPAVIGGLAAARSPRNPIGWLVVAGIFGITLQGAFTEWGAYTILGGHDLPGGWLGPWSQNWMWILFMGLGGTFVLFFFPTGELPSPRWRWPFRFSIGAVCLGSVGLALDPDMLGYPVRNPIGVDAVWVEIAGGVGLMGFMLSLVLAASSLVARARRARGIERLQIRWVRFSGSIVAAAIFAYGMSAVFNDIERVVNAKWFEYLIQVAFLCIPISIGIAILRYRLYEIDRIINKTLVYGLLTALLGALTAVFAIALSAAVRAVAGEDQSAFVVAISTLAAAAAFRPLRARIQGVIDRRFYRSRYDAQRSIESFSARMREQVDLSSLGSSLVHVVDETMQPASVSLWMRGAPS